MKPEWMAAITAPNPETIVDRLNGIYPSAVGPYATSPLQREAAEEIVRLREAIGSIAEMIKRCDYTPARSAALSILEIKNAPKGAS